MIHCNKGEVIIMATALVRKGDRIRVFVHGVRSMFQPLKVRNMRLRSLGTTSDREALASDWGSVGDDIREAMTTYGARTIK